MKRVVTFSLMAVLAFSLSNCGNQPGIKEDAADTSRNPNGKQETNTMAPMPNGGTNTTKDSSMVKDTATRDSLKKQ